MKVEITNATFSRLERLAEGFDTPEAVIIRLLDMSEGRTETKPLLSFDPSDENEFKFKLIEHKEAEVVLFKNDGTREILRWNANRFSESSNLRGNLWSGLLRDWRNKNIKSAQFSILPRGLNLLGDDTEQMKSLALELELTFDELSQLHYEIQENISNDGHPYNYIVQFHDDCDKKLLAKIDGLDEHLWINIPTYVLDE